MHLADTVALILMDHFYCQSVAKLIQEVLVP